MYSSIEEEQRREVMEKCYYPLLELAEDDIPIGIELTGLTLEIIKEIDGNWLNRFKFLLHQNKIELIGSGYSQIIGPLLPKLLNLKNQELGLETYKTILDIEPQIALINEMVYSAGVLDIYAKIGYKAVVMEWNNQHRFHKEQDKSFRYFPQYAAGISETLPIIWADSIAFQKFQRYAQGEISFKEYFCYLQHHNSDDTRYFPLYANDAETFNFRSGRYQTETQIEHNEWKRIEKLFYILKNRKDMKLIFPSQALKGLKNNRLVLESPKQPIPVKKQEKYNINRWALTGRDNLKINTEVYRIYKALLNGNPDDNDWKELCYLSASDFRTHITYKRWQKYAKELDNFSKKWNLKEELPTFANYKDKNKRFKIKESKFAIDIETNGIKLVLNKLKGLAVRELYFKNKGDKPLIGTIPHGYYEDISLGADFFSCHSIIEKPGRHKYVNLSGTEPHVEVQNNAVVVSEEQRDRDIIFRKSYFLFLDKAKLNIKIDIDIPKREIAIIHPLNMTFIPESFDKTSLFYSTNNGGNLETFRIENVTIDHSQALSTLISAKYGLGATEGILIVGDKDKQIKIYHDQTVSALIPFLYYQPIDNTFFLRVQYSAQEIDDTFKENNNTVTVSCLFSIE